MHPLVTEAAALARDCLAKTLPRRWDHVHAVARKANRISTVTDRPHLLVAAAWLHDIGYAPHLAETGLHALDAGRHLIRQNWPHPVADLVAYHSCAVYEAVERGLERELVAEFTYEPGPAADALWYADMTTGPDGQDMTVLHRLAEIRERYGPDSVITQFWHHAEPELLDAVQRTHDRLILTVPVYRG